MSPENARGGATQLHEAPFILIHAALAQRLLAVLSGAHLDAAIVDPAEENRVAIVFPSGSAPTLGELAVLISAMTPSNDPLHPEATE